MMIARELPVGTHQIDPPVGMGLGREIRVGG
ncbi:hypothetical protein NRS6134_09980 [Bacillus subtilis]|nr:hypothetical protein NRS6107_00098 [Bacillus subtilis]CAF1740808.1 hypothetical protein NRS6116_01167 [Bacillus subtilis]CAF1761688.1 hypothetical protein NRS6120_01553 [Bacillus subtilis]CAF1782525.1 hypothetical protein NRS6108_03902 [Bacillus subtilis]CAF1793877.1 hypothetical protein NRS6134_00095 [Bacillus subtilis]